jgi:hypothetical protein
LCEIFDGRKAAQAARVFFDVGGVAESALRGVASFGGVHASGAIFLGTLREVEGEFVVEVVVELIAMEEGAEAGEKLFRPCWHVRTLLLIYS